MVTQIQGQRAKELITVNGIPYRLKKDATDPTGYFPYEKMSWINAGCDKIAENAYCCWIAGVVPPAMGSLEKPVSVFALGFNSCAVPMSPAMLSREDMERMHFYTADYSDTARSFVEQFLGMQSSSPSQPNREIMSPFPNLPEQKPTQSAMQPHIMPSPINNKEFLNEQGK